MVYLDKSKNKYSRGFSLVEMVVTIGILALLLGLSVVSYVSFRSQNNLQVGVGSIVEALRYSQNLATQVSEDSAWGVYLTSNSLTIFKGTSFSSRDGAFDQTLNLPSGLSLSGQNEFVFNKVSGTTDTSGTVTIAGSESTKDIIINEKGTIFY